MKCKISRLVLAALLMSGASSAFAGFSGIGKHPAAEAGQEQILAHQYGGAWHQVGDDFYNGQISAKRMDDYLSDPSTLNIAKGQCGYSTDQIWSGQKFKVTAVAKFSGNSQDLGIIDSSGTEHDVMNVQGYGFNISAASKVIDMHDEQFKWQRSGESGTQTSLDSDNADGRDHLITYVITGLPGIDTPVWMMFWEDMNKFSNTPVKRTFADYNDLAIEVRAMPTAVPLPPAGWAGLFTLTGIALARGRKQFFARLTA